LWDEVKDSLILLLWGYPAVSQHRLCIARLLAVEPEILHMDEPCSALEPISTMKLEELLVELKEKYSIVMEHTICSKPQGLLITRLSS
jgi:phosphate transport system ATP-binding protein